MCSSDLYQDILVGDLLGAIDEHGVEPLVHTPAGQGIAWFNELTTVPEIMEQLVADSVGALSGQAKFVR